MKLLELIIFLTFFSCSSSFYLKEWDNKLLLAEKQVRRGNLSEAKIIFDELKKFKVDEKRGEFLKFLHAKILLSENKKEEGIKVLNQIYKSSNSRETKAKASFYAGIIYYENLEEKAKGLFLFSLTMREFPDTIAGFRAFHWLKQHILSKPDGEKKIINFYKKAFKLLYNSQLGDNFLYEAGLTFKEKDKKISLYLFKLIEKNYPKSHLLNDSLWEIANIYRENGNYNESIKYLRKILSKREKSLLFGSYELSLYGKAKMMIGDIYYENLGMIDSAYKNYIELYNDYKKSTLKDDAGYKAARALMKMKKKEGAISLLREIGENLSWTRYGKKAKEFIKCYDMRDLNCELK